MISQKVSVPSTSTADQSVGVESNKKSPKNLITNNGTLMTDANKETLTIDKQLMTESVSNKQQLPSDSLQSNDSTTLKSTQSLIPSKPQPVTNSQSVDPKVSERQQLSTNSQQSSGSLFVQTRKYSKNKNAIHISTNGAHFSGTHRNHKKRFVKNNLYLRVKNLESMIKQNGRTSPQVSRSGQVITFFIMLYFEHLLKVIEDHFILFLFFFYLYPYQR